MNKVEMSVRLRKLKDGENGKNAAFLQLSAGALAYKAGEAASCTFHVHVNDGGELKNPDSLNHPAAIDGVVFGWGSDADGMYLRVSFTPSCTYSGNIEVSAKLDGETYTAYMPVIRVPQGDPGPAGLTYRVTEWMEGVEYRNDSGEAETAGVIRYVDIAVQKDSKGQLLCAHRCIQTHTSSQDNKPSASGSNDYWERFSMHNPIYTPVIMAENSVIGFMQGNSLKIYNGAGNLKAGVSAATGDYPVFYASPRKTPVGAVALFMASNSSSFPGPGTWTEGAIPSSYGPTYKYLWARVKFTMSDGSTAYSGNEMVASYASNGAASDLGIAYCTSKYNTTLIVGWANPRGWQRNMYPPDETYPWLMVRVTVYFTSNTANSVALACTRKHAPSEAPETSLFQVLESGKTKIGEPLGAHLELTPDYNSEGVLPRMEIYDTEGALSAVFDGSKVKGTTELYPSEEDCTFSTVAATASATVPDGYSQDPTLASAVADLWTDDTLTDAGFIDLLKFTGATVSVKKGTCTAESSYQQIVQQCTAELLVDGTAVYTHSVQPTSTTAESSTFSIPASSVRVHSPCHVIQLRVSVSGYTGAEISVTIPAGTNNGRFYNTRYISRYFANGLCLGSSANNHFMVWNKPTDTGECMCFQFLNSKGHGFKITDEGIKVKHPGYNWSDVQI